MCSNGTSEWLESIETPNCHLEPCNSQVAICNTDCTVRLHWDIAGGFCLQGAPCEGNRTIQVKVHWGHGCQLYIGVWHDMSKDIIVPQTGIGLSSSYSVQAL